MYCRRNRWNCNCNCSQNKCNKDELETSCSNVNNIPINNEDECNCGFDDYNVFPDYPVYGQSYVPWQTMGDVYKPEIGLTKGTIFPELYSPYCPNQSIEKIEYIRMTNKIGKGCNG